jgi:glycosyltransferase involved in cell wall biosynthesis
MQVVLATLYGQSKRVLSPSPAADRSLEALGVAPERLVRWERGVDTHLFDPANRDPGAFPGEVKVLYAGRLAREKGIELLAAAFATARERDPRLHLLVAGGGPEEAWLREQLGAGATFLGWLDRPELARAYASSDVFLFCSTTDTYGQVIGEAQASGLAVVAVDAGGPASLIRQRQTGWLCPPEPRELAAAVAQLAASRFLRSRLAAGGREAVRERTWDASLAQLAAGYDRALGLDGRKRSPAVERQVA